MKKIKLTIEGMHCAACKGNIEKSVKTISGINSINVSTLTHKGIVNAEDSVSNDSIKSAVEKVGYKVTNIE
jgi:copper chaperone CopZ